MIKSLRSFINDIFINFRNDFLISDPIVNPKYEISAYIEKLELAGKFPVLYFPHIKGSNMPVITNLITTEKRALFSIGLSENVLIDSIMEKFNKRIKPVYVSDPPVMEKTVSDEPLKFIPKIYHNELDGGPYISSGLIIFRSLEDKLNMGIYRIQIIDNERVAIMTNPHSDANHIIDEYRDVGKSIPVTISIGHHPAIYMAAVTRPGGIGGELEMAGGLIDEPVRLSESKTCDAPFLADSELSIEGVIEDPSYLIDEGPFGEWPGYYSGKQKTPVIHVKSLNMRHNPVYYDIGAARREHLIIGLYPHLVTVYQRVKNDIQDLVDLYLPFSGSHRAICYMSIKKHNEGQPIRAGLIAVTSYPSIKIAVVVDDDIDVKNEQQVLWAVYTRTTKKEQFVIIPDVEAHHLNPSTYNENGATPGNMEVKLVIDATKPLKGFPPRAGVPKTSLVDSNLSNLHNISEEELHDLLQNLEF